MTATFFCAWYIQRIYIIITLDVNHKKSHANNRAIFNYYFLNNQNVGRLKVDSSYHRARVRGHGNGSISMTKYQHKFDEIDSFYEKYFWYALAKVIVLLLFSNFSIKVNWMSKKKNLAKNSVRWEFVCITSIRFRRFCYNLHDQEISL